MYNYGKIGIILSVFLMYFAWGKVQQGKVINWLAQRVLINLGLENHKASSVENIDLKILGKCCNFPNIGMPHKNSHKTCVINSIKLSTKTCILYTAFRQLESNTKLRISVELSGQKNTGKIFTNFRCFYIIFSVLKKARMGQWMR